MLVCVQYNGETKIGHHAFPDSAADAVAWMRKFVDETAAQKFNLADWRRDMYCQVIVRPDNSKTELVCKDGSLDSLWAELVAREERNEGKLRYAYWGVRMLNKRAGDDGTYWF